MEKQEIEKSLIERYDVRSKVADIFGEWIVTSDGDLISLKNSYPIYSNNINDDTLLIHLQDKTWFDRKCEQDFIKAFEKACNILSIVVVFRSDYE